MEQIDKSETNVEEIPTLLRLIQEKKWDDALKLHESSNYFNEKNAPNYYTRGNLLGNLKKIKNEIKGLQKK